MKGDICVYVCFVTKAVFLDLVSNLLTDAFLASLGCFSALYGVPAELHTDNGSNFVGANSELQRLYNLLCSDEAQQTLKNSDFFKCMGGSCMTTLTVGQKISTSEIWEILTFLSYRTISLHVNQA